MAEFQDKEASSRITLDNGAVLTRCDQCRIMYSERKPPGDPPCETCKVDLKNENEEALRIFFVIQSQFIMGMNGPVDINQLAIHAAMDLYDIKNRRECFSKVLILARWRMDRIREDNDG